MRNGAVGEPGVQRTLKTRVGLFSFTPPPPPPLFPWRLLMSDPGLTIQSEGAPHPWCPVFAFPLQLPSFSIILLSFTWVPLPPSPVDSSPPLFFISDRPRFSRHGFGLDAETPSDYCFYRGRDGIFHHFVPRAESRGPLHSPRPSPSGRRLSPLISG